MAGRRRGAGARCRRRPWRSPASRSRSCSEPRGALGRRARRGSPGAGRCCWRPALRPLALVWLALLALAGVDGGEARGAHAAARDGDVARARRRARAAAIPPARWPPSRSPSGPAACCSAPSSSPPAPRPPGSPARPAVGRRRLRRPAAARGLQPRCGRAALTTPDTGTPMIRHILRRHRGRPSPALRRPTPPRPIRYRVGAGPDRHLERDRPRRPRRGRQRPRRHRGGRRARLRARASPCKATMADVPLRAGRIREPLYDVAQTSLTQEVVSSTFTDFYGTSGTCSPQNAGGDRRRDDRLARRGPRVPALERRRARPRVRRPVRALQHLGRPAARGGLQGGPRARRGAAGRRVRAPGRPLRRLPDHAPGVRLGRAAGVRALPARGPRAHRRVPVRLGRARSRSTASPPRSARAPAVAARSRCDVRCATACAPAPARRRGDEDVRASRRASTRRLTLPRRGTRAGSRSRSATSGSRSR